MGSKKDFPTTIDEAVGVLIAMLTDEEMAEITAKNHEQLMDLHFGLGMWIRNNFGLWNENSALLKNTGERDADNAAGVIIEALWNRLREAEPKVH